VVNLARSTAPAVEALSDYK